MYRTLKPSKADYNSTVSMMPKKGINKESYAQVMDLEYCLESINYIPHSYGLRKRGGQAKIFERVGNDTITLLKRFTTGVWIFGYSTKIEAYNETTETFTTIKSDFSVNDGFDGGKYGEYFLVCNGVEKIWRIDNTLAIAEVGTSPICGGLKFIGNRCYAFRLSTDETAVQYSEVDDSSNPPFDGWTQTTATDTGGTVNYRNAGAVRSVVQLGVNTVVFSDDGFFAYLTNTIDSGGVLKKEDVIQNYIEDFGGARGAIETPVGIFYVNEAGLWQMVAVGNTDTPMSRQQINVTNLLGADYFEDVDMSNVDIIYDEKQKIILVTCAKDSPFNNTIIGVKPEIKNSVFFFNNWNLSRFAKDGSDIYGASSTKTTVYKLFEGFDDDGLEIGTEYYQEIPLKTLFFKHALNGIYAGGFLTPEDELTISFDIYDIDGNIVYNKDEYLWTGEESSLDYDEWGLARYGESGYGGSFPTAGLVESFGGGSPRINNLQRLRVRIVGGSKTEHILNWIAVKTRIKRAIRRRNISKIT